MGAAHRRPSAQRIVLQALEGGVTTSPAPANEMCTEPVGSAPSRPAMITDAHVWGGG